MSPLSNKSNYKTSKKLKIGPQVRAAEENSTKWQSMLSAARLAYMHIHIMANTLLNLKKKVKLPLAEFLLQKVLPWVGATTQKALFLGKHHLPSKDSQLQRLAL